MFGLITELSRWAIPVVLLMVPLIAALRGVKVYETFVGGAEAGFATAVKIIPYLVAMMVAISIFRASGAMEALVMFLSPFLNIIGLPAEVLPHAIMRRFQAGRPSVLPRILLKPTGRIALSGAWCPPCRAVATLPFTCSPYISVPSASANTVIRLSWAW